MIDAVLKRWLVVDRGAVSGNFNRLHKSCLITLLKWVGVYYNLFVLYSFVQRVIFC